jgi:crotonobetainyl-CoA:carnitine CoA-transferase CaiB-like acyl-CoA transferase
VANNDALVALLADTLHEQPSAHWLAALEAAGIPSGPVMHYDEVFTDPHILAREMVTRTEHPVTGTFHTLGVTVKLSDTPGSVRLPAPRLGEHTAEVLGRRSAAAD